MLALIDLPLTTDQRSSPWSNRTRRELRQLARSLISDQLTRPGEDAESSIDGEDRGMTATVNISINRLVACKMTVASQIIVDKDADVLLQCNITSVPPNYRLAMQRQRRTSYLERP